MFVCRSDAIANTLRDKLIEEGIFILDSLPDGCLKDEAQICYDACIGASLIVFNLFSLEGYFIAQHFNIPCIAVSPFLVHRTPPVGFEEKLSKALPAIYDALKLSSDTVSYSEVDHWMWRLFLDDYGALCHHLHLSTTIPFPSINLPKPTPLFYGLSPALISRQPYWPNR